jgi:hypothetical protein
MERKGQPRLPRRGKPPDWPPEVRQEVVHWLNDKLAQMENAQIRLRMALKIANLEWIRKNLEYYQHAAGFCKWLIHYAGGNPRRPKKGKDQAEDESGISASGGSASDCGAAPGAGRADKHSA